MKIIKTKPVIINYKKRKRKDVKERLEANKAVDVSSVKQTWNQFCKDNFMKKGIEDIVLNINKIAFLSYKLMDFHVVRLMEKGLKPPEITQNLYYNACCYVSECKKSKTKEIYTTDELYKSFLCFKPFIKDIPARDKMCNLINNLNRQQVTVAHNHLKLNFYKRFRKYLSLRTGETLKSILYQWSKAICSEDYSGKNPFIIYMRDLCKYTPTETNIKKHTSHFLTVYYKILKEFEKYPNTKGVRTFNLLPTKDGFTPSHIDIDNSSMGDLISHFTNKPVGTDMKNKVKRRAIWLSLFNIQKIETKRRKFNYTISTDGIAVTITLHKPKLKDANKIDIMDKKYKRFVGIDPGSRAVFTAYTDWDSNVQTIKELKEQRKNEEVKQDTFPKKKRQKRNAKNKNRRVKSMRTKEYRHNCKMKYATRKRENWYKKWNKKEYWKNIPTSKSSVTSKQKEYLAYVLPHYDMLQKYHQEKSFRQLRFTAYCRQKAVLTEICKYITGDERNTLVGYGDFAQQSGLVKGHPTAPIVKLRKELSKHCTLKIMNEYATSKTCSFCYESVCQYRNRHINKKGKQRLQGIYGVIRCKSNECKLCTMDRDINASRNILYLLKLEYNKKNRPSCFKPAKTDCDTVVGGNSVTRVTKGTQVS